MSSESAVLVTGASTGIGAVYAERFARRGHDLVLVARNHERLTALAERLRDETGVQVDILQADLTQDSDIAAVEQRLREDARIRILVNNAGRQQYCESIEDLTTEAFDATFKTNVYAPFWITKAAIPHLQEGAVIINTTSVQAYQPSPILLDYAQTKACGVAFTKALAQQLGSKGIRVNAVAPGPYWTVLQSSGGQPEEKVKQFGASAPLGRPGQPVEIAPLYVLFASDESSYSSGQVWCSDGGTGTL